MVAQKVSKINSQPIVLTVEKIVKLIRIIKKKTIFID